VCPKCLTLVIPTSGLSLLSSMPCSTAHTRALMR
jgi:hypothetical protein